MELVSINVGNIVSSGSFSVSRIYSVIFFCNTIHQSGIFLLYVITLKLLKSKGISSIDSAIRIAGFAIA